MYICSYVYVYNESWKTGTANRPSSKRGTSSNKWLCELLRYYLQLGVWIAYGFGVTMVTFFFFVTESLWPICHPDVLGMPQGFRISLLILKPMANKISNWTLKFVNDSSPCAMPNKSQTLTSQQTDYVLSSTRLLTVGLWSLSRTIATHCWIPARQWAPCRR